jgi:hypothetical protein
MLKEDWEKLPEAQSIKFRILLKEEQTAGELLINIE